MGGVKPDFLREEDNEFEVSTTAEEKFTRKSHGKPSKKRQYKVRDGTVTIEIIKTTGVVKDGPAQELQVNGHLNVAL